MNNWYTSKLIWLIGVILLGFTLYINVVQLNEAFGSGPPYYSRTTNMDKWSNPVPYLALLDLIILLLLYGLWKWRGKANADKS